MQRCDSLAFGLAIKSVVQFQDLGDQYSINYARAVNLASALYEQPSNLGIPMAFMASMTAMGTIHAKVCPSLTH